MKRSGGESGFTLLEMLVGLTLFLLVTSGLTAMLIQNSKLNKSQQLKAEIHDNARNCMAMLVRRIRSAGWDPRRVGIPAVVLDPENNDGNDADGVDAIEIYSDLDADAATTGAGEQLLIRFRGERIEWRTSSDPAEPFVVLADGISNDSDGDGSSEPMFVADSVSNPTRLTLRITARSSVRDPVSGEYLRYSVSSEVALRRAL